MRKWLIALALGCTAALTAAQGQQQQQEKTLYYTNDQTVAVTPAAGPQVNRSWNPYLTADFIWWTVREDGLFHAVTGVAANPSKGRVHDIDVDWEPGFKVGLGFNLPHDGWDVFANYTWIKSSVSGSKSTDAGDMISYWSIGGAPLTGITNSRASWDITFHNLNFEIGRNCYLSQFLKLRLFAGVQAAWIYQDYDVRQVVAADDSIDRLRLDQDFWGAGIRAGLNTAWQFTQNWSIYADLALAILYGEFDLDRRDSNQPQGGVETTSIHTGVDPMTFEPTVGVGAGLRWETWFGSNNYHILFQLGWEQQIWILQNEFIKVPTETDHVGDLVLQGLTLKGRFDF
ncbi:Lpg1974 family pore-forming outer membrane protein [Simkania sp.]|uniref:Lpg1974 family pore-forming outer membrane protein n=1 Tax=Simkania sp. TaxID=34094 RepID=UPI003B52C6D1